MATQTLVKKLNKEVRDLRKDVAAIKAVLLSALKIPEESLKSYKNADAIKRALSKALKNFPAS